MISNAQWNSGAIVVEKMESGITAGGLGTCIDTEYTTLYDARVAAMEWALSGWSRSAQIKGKFITREWWGTNWAGTLVNYDEPLPELETEHADDINYRIPEPATILTVGCSLCGEQFTPAFSDTIVCDTCNAPALTYQQVMPGFSAPTGQSRMQVL